MRIENQDLVLKSTGFSQSSLLVLLLVYTTIFQLEIFIQSKLTHVVFFVVLFFGIVSVISSVIKTNLMYLVIVSFFVFIFTFSNGILTSLDLGVLYRSLYFCFLCLVPLFAHIHRNSLEFVVSNALRFYYLLAALIVLDGSYWFLFGKSFISQVEFYITPRFSGPFYDPNFLGFIYGIMFCVEWSRDRNLIRLMLFLLCIAMSGSWAAIILCAISFFFSRYFNIRYYVVIPILCAFMTSFISVLVYNFSPLIEQHFVSFFTYVTGFNDAEMIAKYISFSRRFDSVSIALNLSLDNIFGYGYFTILDYIPRDPHNSYVGILFEFGIFALLAVFLSMLVKGNSNNKGAIFLVFFVSTSAVLLNIHYMPIYILSVLCLVELNNSHTPSYSGN